MGFCTKEQHRDFLKLCPLASNFWRWPGQTWRRRWDGAFQ